MIAITPPLLVFLTVAGILAGVVVNALSDDLPARVRPSLPHFPDGTRKPVLLWSGLVAYLLGRRNTGTGRAIRWRYPLTEISTALLFVLTALAVQDDPKMTTPQFIVWLVYMAIFMLITVIDLEHRLILFVVIIPSCILALLDAALFAHGADLGRAVLGALLGFAIFFLLYLGGFVFTAILSSIRGERIEEVAFGYGDVMLITLSGLILGWQALIIAIFITVILGAAGAILYLVVRRLAGRHYSLFTPLPYGQYIIIATILMMLFSAEIQRFLRGF